VTLPGEDALRAVLDQLDPARRAELTAGETGWSTVPAPEVGLRPVVLVDGPLGLVSPTFDERDTSLLLPCGTALGATWDAAVVRSVAAAEASEARRRGHDGVYAPNLNLARTGLSGRTFEMLSEDPQLAGVLGAAFVQGVQGQGVASFPKHLVCNDTETERQRMSATVDPVTLREVYLRPFELAVAAGAWGVMTAYNGLNGVPCAEDAALLGVLKDEWGFDGLTVSDYFALKQTLGPALAGLDLEMPGPAIHLGAKLAAAVAAGQVPQERVDDAVLRLLRLAGRVGALPGHERLVTAPDERVAADAAAGVLAAAAAAAFTLVRNEGALLPLDGGGTARLAVLGPNAARPCFQGATFGRIRPATPPVTPLDALRARFAGEVVHEPGIARTRPEPLGEFAVTAPDGTPGVLLEHSVDGAGPVLTEVRGDSSFIWFGTVPGVGPTTQPGSLRLTAVLTPQVSGVHLLGAGGSGDTTLSVDGRPLTERPAPAPQDVMGQVARAEMTTGAVELTAGVPVTVVVEMRSAGSRVQALTVGCLPPQPEGALARAVAAAAAADAVVLVVGDVLETSRESRDLDDSALPAAQEQLIREVAAVNPRTVVVVNAGRPVHAPWADDVAAVLFAWFPGQEFGPALAGVLAGDREPGGRMPVTVPLQDADRSTWGERLDADLALDYTATEPVGYRHLQRTARPARFPFGSGEGYTSWDTADPEVTVDRDGAEVAVTVRNTGAREGRDVVQVYVQAPGEDSARLAGFSGVRLGAGESARVSVLLDQRAFQRWDADAGWVVGGRRPPGRPPRGPGRPLLGGPAAPDGGGPVRPTEQAAATDRTPDRSGRPRIALAIACATQFICVLDVSIVNVALPAMRTDLALSPAGLQWVVNGYTLTFAGFLLLGGRAADLLGRRNVFVAGLVLFTLASLAAGLAQEGWQLVAARVVQGLGGAILAPTALSLITTTFTEPAARARALAALTAAAGSGGALGGVIGGVLTGLLSWRWVFFVNVPLGALIVVGALWALPGAVRQPLRGRLDLPGSFAVTTGTAALVAAIVVSESRGWTSGPTLVLLALALVLLTAFVLRERGAAHPLVPLQVFRIRSLALANGLSALIGGVLPATMFFLSLHLQQVLGMSPLRAGVALLPGAVGIAAGAWAASRLVARGAKATFIAGCLVTGGALAWLSGIDPGAGYAFSVAVPLFAAMFGFGVSGLPLTVAATSGVGPHWAGLASGLLNTARQVGGAVGLAALVTVAATHTAGLLSGGGVGEDAATTSGFGVALLCGAAVLLLAALGGTALPRAARARATAEPVPGA
jgi:beta-glucosidase